MEITSPHLTSPHGNNLEVSRLWRGDGSGVIGKRDLPQGMSVW
jgi:hypothetical protein